MDSLVLEVKNQDPAGTLEVFLAALLENGVVDALLLPRVTSKRTSVAHVLVKSPGSISDTAALLPLCNTNVAGILSKLTFTDPGGKIGVVVRSCEVRALVELVKLNQATLEKLVLIGFDCLGTLEPQEYRRQVEEGALEPADWIKGVREEGDLTAIDGKVRNACRICAGIVPEYVHIHIGWVGMDVESLLAVQAVPEILPQLKEIPGMQELPLPARRQELIDDFTKKRLEARERAFSKFDDRYGSYQGFLSDLTSCIHCLNCRRVCPICFCRQCVFEGAIFDYESDQYVKWAGERGGIKMPADTALYHMTRLNHMGLSCVGCGQCESACPGSIPLSLIYQGFGKKFGELFDYMPGRSPDDKLPLTTYKENELDPR